MLVHQVRSENVLFEATYLNGILLGSQLAEEEQKQCKLGIQVTKGFS